MATIFVNGCFDLLHVGHARFLHAARYLGGHYNERLIAAVNSDESAKRLKTDKWGSKYPVDGLITRMKKLMRYVDEVYAFSNDDELTQIILRFRPLVICKGPDYLGKYVVGAEHAPVVILDTYETDEVREFKKQAYARTL